MPRISAGSVAEHVARQEQAVFDAAIRLFTEQGYRAVTLADIAAEVGLARNSLYRYFPTKASILLQWFRNEMPELVQTSTELLEGDGPPARRIERWAVAQIDYAHRPEHQLIAELGQAAGDLDVDARAELAAGHEQLMAPFRAALAEAGLDGAELTATADLLWNAVLAQTRRELAAGDDPSGRAVLARCIDALVGPAPDPRRRRGAPGA
ncbi:TetR/AcrR family transcriptional regulator [Aquihabitans sp. McL0605]|uniref:TetR/AcrR family transcriptional regulator n=1 Tax=Aquihabitans sp. McL0605 TaxID=3415671 RepID=UPI003CF5F312